jgi:hypothetical protein
MAASRQPRRRPKVEAQSPAEPLLTFPVGVLVRDNDNRVYYLSLAQLDQFRRQDLEIQSVWTQFDAGGGLLGLKNAWLIESIGNKSGC